MIDINYTVLRRLSILENNKERKRIRFPTRKAFLLSLLRDLFYHHRFKLKYFSVFLKEHVYESVAQIEREEYTKSQNNQKATLGEKITAEVTFHGPMVKC